MDDHDSREISRLLGKLEADAETRQHQTETLFAEIKELRSCMNGLASDVRSYHGTVLALEKTVAEQEVAISDYRKLRAQGRGLLIGVALAASSMSAGAATMLSKWFGNG